MAKESPVQLSSVPSVEELGNELGQDPAQLGYWSQGGTVELGEYTWYGPSIAAVPDGGSRTNSIQPSQTTQFRISIVNKDGDDNQQILHNLTVGGKFKYGFESWTIDSFTTVSGAVDIYVSSHEGPNTAFLAVATEVLADSDVYTLRSSVELINLGFKPTEIEVPVVKPKPWTWSQVLAVLNDNGVDSVTVPWEPLTLLGEATGIQDSSKFTVVADTMQWKGEISSAARDDLVALTTQTEEGTETQPGPARWVELWGISTIQISLVNDARDYALENHIFKA